MDNARGTHHPEPYFFLYTAGVIDRNDTSSRETKRCAESLRTLASLNGSYKLLDTGFRADMREALGCTCDTKVKLVLARLADACDAPESVPDDARHHVRAHFANLARFWPEQPNKVLPPLA